ncbi:hypothetical protein AUJ65_03280 [Candidatus Micrarchaeota archaeon CG1_02_51_15]|nr:MAG: hypothetical protein AUJ65_03280 [Candidatus Micrarchaeota archaeon CG1_02_51_15]
MVYVDAREYLQNVLETEYSADTLAAFAYAVGGIRAVAIGNMMYAEKDEAGCILKPSKNDFVRLAVPRTCTRLNTFYSLQTPSKKFTLRKTF